ncbi:O-methyltransferase [Paenibacillus aurantius]|uniref:O-methyltransferase n=1 Tax=Paenibacillus aurantius TaxID=2918900 RepID=A0AA96LF41_9BACL|nr:O-methyltransferase [Paenibacillus aurantius]WJH32216.1 O-methyltransferase [Paenibacillus sp. CC-CFT747]WNQ12591.1 O-methyltransferase [Paenibacillus aurantius]
MILEQLPLSKQVEIVFREIKDELCHLSSGIVFIQVRNNVVGKFGVKHNPMESKSGVLEAAEKGLTELHFHEFRKMAVDSLRYKKNWTHGEIFYEFAVKKESLYASFQFESNYNMASLFMNKEAKRDIRETV